ncbi:hypothetical protein [Streptomyces arboris]|uniref:helix-turn-helix domain-containing protein n=1 Tax=Streptomyces arboris TaxID=2600619 RepID=UPI003BF48AA8
MSGIARSSANSSKVERGELPEVAALGNTLTDLFNALGISQSAYAVRVSMDKSVVSRYLRGKRIAPQDFIDRLVREVEAHRKAPIKIEAKSNLQRLRMDALKVCDPDAYQLAAMRNEMEKSHRDIQRLTRHQEALHDLIAKKESQVFQLKRELEQMREDWQEDVARLRISDLEHSRGKHQAESDRDTLLGQIQQLKAELCALVQRKQEAESRCEELEQRIVRLEEEVGQTRERVTGINLPLPFLQRQIEEHWEKGRHSEAERELMEAAWERRAEDVCALLIWLMGRSGDDGAKRVLVYFVRTRSVDDVASVGNLLHGRFTNEASAVVSDLYHEVSIARSPEDIAQLQTHWLSHTRQSLRSLLASFLTSRRSQEEKMHLISLVGEDAIPYRIIRDICGRPHMLSTTLPMLPTLIRLGYSDIINDMFSILTADVKRESEVGQALARAAKAYSSLPAAERDGIVDSLAKSAETGQLVSILGLLCLSGAYISEEHLARIFERISQSGRIREVMEFTETRRAEGVPKPGSLNPGSRSAALHYYLTHNWSRGDLIHPPHA